MSEGPILDRRSFCQHLGAAGVFAALGSVPGRAQEPSSAAAPKSIPTTGTIKPIFESVVCPWSPSHPRNDQQLLFPLSDGRTMFVWCQYYINRPSLVTRQIDEVRGQPGDTASCRICAKVSTDDCRSWSDAFVLEENRWNVNVKNPHMLRLPSGEILFFFTGADSHEQRTIFLRRSKDECETWSDKVPISGKGWIANNHNRILRLRSGRIVLPAFSPLKDGVLGAPLVRGTPLHSFAIYSDDEFKTWKQSENTMTAPGRGAHEPSMVELNDGRVLCILRTTTGRLYKAYSSDEGVHWSTPEPTEFPSPDSEPLVARIPATGDLLLVWNNVESNTNGPRRPLTAAISRDEGATWGHFQDIDARPDFDAAYPLAYFQGDEVVVTHYTRKVSTAVAIEPVVKIYKVEQFYA